MKNVSLQFNKFYHKCVLSDLYNKAPSLQIRSLIDTRTGGAFRIYKYEDYNCVDELKQLLKILNVNYEVDEQKDCKISTKDIEVQALLDHIEWVIKVGVQNSIELDFVRLEWEQLKNQYKGY